MLQSESNTTRRKGGRQARDPSFPIYPGDLLVDPRIACLSATELGVHFKMLLFAWMNPLPADLALVQQMAGGEMTPRVQTLWRIVDGYLQNDYLEGVRADREAFRAEQKRKSDRAHGKPAGSPRASSGQPTGVPRAALPFPSPSPSPFPLMDASMQEVSVPGKNRDGSPASTQEAIAQILVNAKPSHDQAGGATDGHP